jgi:hypothetical protein
VTTGTGFGRWLRVIAVTPSEKLIFCDKEFVLVSLFLLGVVVSELDTRLVRRSVIFYGFDILFKILFIRVVLVI